MSLLINESYANPTTPFWLTAAQTNENIIANNVTINQGGSIRLGSSINDGTTLIFNKAVDGSTSSVLQEEYRGGGGGATNLELSVFDQTGHYDTIGLGDIDVYGKGAATGTANYINFQGTGGSFGLSYGNNNTRTAYLDKLETGNAVLTSNTIGPVPVTISTGGPFSISPVPTSPAAYQYFGFGVTYPTTAGNEYDCYAMGTFTLASGTPDATIPDIMAGSFFVGTGTTGTGNFYYNPETGNWIMRARLIPGSNAASIRVGFQNTQKGTSTAVYNATCTLCDIVRVK